MEQRLRQDLRKFHDLFTGDRCSAWQLEELIVAAIKSDTQAQHHVKWQEAGHDDKADILVIINGREHAVQIKSGQIQEKKASLTLSGHRFGRFDGDLKRITEYLNSAPADIIAVPYKKRDGERGREHAYQIVYIPRGALTGVDSQGWAQHGKQWRTVNSSGTVLSLRPSMSWQIWWEIPLSVVRRTDWFTIG
ncbi:MAG TPA: hypothetical protein DDX54_01925 [Rhodospirillaceae bacterium]|jgi:hypothetical protein|nr:hypothetical protein [Rhodospirillaceae bacterium]